LQKAEFEKEGFLLIRSYEVSVEKSYEILDLTAQPPGIVFFMSQARKLSSSSRRHDPSLVPGAFLKASSMSNFKTLSLLFRTKLFVPL
jgi:hypothetical protein